MKGPVGNTARIARIGLVVALLALMLGAGAGAASRFDPDHDRDNDTLVGATFRLTVSPGRKTVLAGATARYTLRIRRRRFQAPVSFRLASRLPRGFRVRFSSRSTRGGRVTLVIRTSPHVRLRRYRVRVRASAGGLNRTVTLTLRVIGADPAGTGAAVTVPASLSISGNAAGPLEPGVRQPLALQITNPNSTPLTVASLSVAVQAIQAPHATTGLPCSNGDFSVQQYSGPLPLVIPASSTRSLAGLGIAPAGWPQISLLDLPTNQDGCQGASVALSYAARATIG